MGHPSIENKTPFSVEPVFLADEDGRPLLVTVAKATYSLLDDGRVLLADEQVPVNLSGEYWGEPGESSYKYEPEGAFAKPATDIVLIGHAHARLAGDTAVSVTLHLGDMRRTIKVTGDRTWVKSLGSISMTSPEPFERLPLVYERAFGGWDRSLPDPQRHACEPRNPVGTGFRLKSGNFEEGIRVPNLEDPQHCISKYGDAPPPAGFAFTSPDWQPRAGFAGTYDDVWMKQRMPFLPLDFDRKFFNAASPGLIVPGFLKGNESVLIENATAAGRLSFQLPGVAAPACRVELRGTSARNLTTQLDTVLINTDDRLLFLIWRINTVLRNGPEDVLSLNIKVEPVGEMVAKWSGRACQP
jgi:hypothetical protein